MVVAANVVANQFSDRVNTRLQLVIINIVGCKVSYAMLVTFWSPINRSPN